MRAFTKDISLAHFNVFCSAKNSIISLFGLSFIQSHQIQKKQTREWMLFLVHKLRMLQKLFILFLFYLMIYFYFYYMKWNILLTWIYHHHQSMYCRSYCRAQANSQEVCTFYLIAVARRCRRCCSGNPTTSIIIKSLHLHL